MHLPGEGDFVGFVHRCFHFLQQCSRVDSLVAESLAQHFNGIVKFLDFFNLFHIVEHIHLKNVVCRAEVYSPHRDGSDLNFFGQVVVKQLSARACNYVCALGGEGCFALILFGAQVIIFN